MVKVESKDKDSHKLVHVMKPQAILQILQHGEEEKNRERPDRVKN